MNRVKQRASCCSGLENLQKRSVEYHTIAARHSVEAYTPAKSDSLRNFHKPPPEKMQCLGIAIVELDQQNP